MAIRSASFVFLIGVLLSPAAWAGPPEARPLPSQRKTESPGDAGLWIYRRDRVSGELKKVALFDTGLAIGKPRPNTPIPESKTRLVLERRNPLRGKLDQLQARGWIVLPTDDRPRGLLETAGRQEFEWVMPVISTNAQDPRPELVLLPELAIEFLPESDVQSLLEEWGLEVKQKHRGNLYTLTFKGGQPTYTRVIETAQRAYESGKVRSAQPNGLPLPQRAAETADPRLADQWHLENTGAGGGTVDADVDAFSAWAAHLGDRNIRIAIIDDSVEKDHPDLEDNFILGRYYDGGAGTVDPDPSPRTKSGKHGTSCSGVAVACANDIGVRGVAPGCGLIGVHFWDASLAQTADAFRFCADPDDDPSTDDGAAVISCSWSWNPAFDAVSDAIEDVAANGRGGKGIVILFAAGNDYGTISANQHFASLDAVFCVGATNWRDDHSPYSNHGWELDIVAPSNDIDTPGALAIDTTDVTDRNGETWGYAVGDYTGTGFTGFGGTSSATPLTAGICGLVLSVNPALTAKQVRSILEHTADPVRGVLRPASYFGTTRHDHYYGHGRVNARNAVLAAHASLLDGSLVWPTEVSGTSVVALANDGGTEITWTNPPENLAGVLVVKSANGIAWRPTDGERYQVGQVLGCGDLEVLSLAEVESLTDLFGEPSTIYAIFPFTAEHRYGWGAIGMILEDGPGGSGVAVSAPSSAHEGRRRLR